MSSVELLANRTYTPYIVFVMSLTEKVGEDMIVPDVEQPATTIVVGDQVRGRVSRACNEYHVGMAYIPLSFYPLHNAQRVESHWQQYHVGRVLNLLEHGGCRIDRS